MRTAFFIRPIIIVLILILSIPHSLFAQKQSRKQALRHANHPAQISDDVIADLLAMQPLLPEEDAAETTSEDEAKPPADNAPIKELLEYWTAHNSGISGQPKPSETVQQRLLEAVLNRPEWLQRLMGILPDTPATHDQIYQLLQSEPEEGAYWKITARVYLQHRSQYFRDDLLAEARSDEFDARRGSLPSLAKLDWEAAKPIVEQMLGGTNPDGAALALGVQHEHAVSTGDAAQAESVRAKLKAMVSNRQANPFVRWQALASVMASEWPGQEEWFLNLFADPTLSRIAVAETTAPPATDQETKSVREGVGVERVERVVTDVKTTTTLTATRTIVSGGIPADPGNSLLVSAFQGKYAKWLSKVIPLVGNADRTIHNAAVKFLVEANGNLQENEEKTLAANRQDVARALLPWLTNPLWASVEGRDSFVDKLGYWKLPEAVPGLLTILESESDRDVIAAAVRALMEYKDPRAVGSLKRLLQKETDERQRDPIITAIALCGGYSEEEMAATFEVYARKESTNAGAEAIGLALEGEKTFPLNISIGRVLYESDRIPATEGLAVRLFARAKELRFKEPAVAQKILAGIQFVPLQVAQLNLLERIGEGQVDAEAISFALENRRDWQKSVSEAIYPLLKQGGYAAGIAAVLLGEPGRQTDILEGKDSKAQLALLAAARHVREKLPVNAVAPLLTHPLLAKAAESYLEIENSAAARTLIWAQHPKQAWIVGEGLTTEAQNNGEYGHHRLEKKLQREVLSQNGKLEIYAVLTKFYGAEGEENGNIFVRVRGEEAEINLPNSNGYRRFRALTANELRDLKALTAKPEIEDLGPESFPETDEDGETNGPAYEYLRLSQEGGRRILFDQFRPAPKKDATLHEELAGFFYTLSRTGDFKLRYALEDKLPGLEVLSSSEKQRIMSVAQEGTDICVLVNERNAAQGQRIRELFSYEWRSFAAGQIGSIVSPPAALAESFEAAKTLRSGELLAPVLAPLFGQIMPKQKVAYAAVPFEGEPGIWKLAFGGERIKLREGRYLGVVVTPDEKWLVTTRMTMDAEQHIAPNATPTLVRMNLQSGEEFPVAMPTGTSLWARVFVPARQQVLLSDQSPFAQAPAGKYFLLDPATGKLQAVKGEVRPLLQNAARTLQPTGKPDEVWTSIYDETKRATVIGRYNTATFTFAPALELPELGAQITEFWVDAAAGKIYFVHDGNLLRVALPKP